jgi:hypothetical protein
MPLTGPIAEGRTFFCPHCGALYSVTRPRLPESAGGAKSAANAVCVVCQCVMDEKSAAKGDTYKLVHRPEDA